MRFSRLIWITPPFIHPSTKQMTMARNYQVGIALPRIFRAGALALCIAASAHSSAQPVEANPSRGPAAIADRRPVAKPCAKPEWPNGALRGELQGVVTLTFLVDVDGTVAETRLIKSSGSARIDEATIKGLSKCTFEPATMGGTPVQSWQPIQYVWVIDGTRGSRDLAGPAAVAQLRLAAAKGDMVSQFWTAVAYRTGRHVPRDDAAARYWYFKAAQQGHALAQFNLALIYLSGEGVKKNETEAVAWMRKAAEQGHTTAQFNMGAFYIRGQGVAKNAAEAERWMRRAAEQGSAPAQVQLGDMYDEGRGVPADAAQSAAWYRKAAEQGNVTGQYYLAQCYEYGVGVAKDLKAASAWYEKAAAQGHRESTEALALLKPK